MASGSSNERLLSTKRIFRVNKKNIHNFNSSGSVKSPTNNTFGIAHKCTEYRSDNSIDDDKLSNSTYHKSNRNHQQQQQQPKLSPNSQNYSSRNFLRASQSANASNHNHQDNKNIYSTKMPNLFDHEEIKFIPIKDLDTLTNFEPLNADSFVRVIDDSKHFYCMLCCKRGLAHDWVRHSNSHPHSQKFFDLQKAIYRQPFDKSGIQLNSINQLLRKWYNDHYLSQEDKFIRDNVVEEFKEILSHIDPECNCRLFGSYPIGTALKSSNINLELVHPNTEIFAKDPRARNSIHHKIFDPSAEHDKQLNNHVVQYDLIPNAVETLYNILSIFKNPLCDIPNFQILSDHRDLNKKTPTLTLLHKITNIELQVCCYAEGSYRLSTLIQIYLSLDYRALILSFLVRYWAKICRIDNPDHGTLPPEAYTILVIYFLQRTSPPVLPCLHETVIQTSKTNEPSTKSNVSHPVIDGEVEPGEKINKTSIDLLDAEDLEDEKELGFMELTSEDLKNFTWNSSNKDTINTLFANFMRFMIDEFNDVVKVITIRTLKEVNVDTKANSQNGWTTQIKAIENPARPGTNMSSCISTHRTFNYIYECFKHCYFYLTSIPIMSYHQTLKPRRERMPEPRDYIKLFTNKEKLEFYFQYILKTLANRPKTDPVREMLRNNLFAKDVVIIHSLLFYMASCSEGYENELPQMVASSYNEEFLVPRDVTAVHFCRICKEIGHVRSECPRRKIESLHSELELFDHRLDRDASLDYCLTKLYERSQITPRIRRKHFKVVEELTSIINTSLNLNCKMQLFGSTVNNLGSIDSDLDICMTINGVSGGENIDCVNILQKVYDVFSEVEEIKDLEQILTARVPILRFKYEIFDVDLSMYNQCATHNSELLKHYSMIDKRVAQIFYLVKRFAKVSYFKQS